MYILIIPNQSRNKKNGENMRNAHPGCHERKGYKRYFMTIAFTAVDDSVAGAFGHQTDCWSKKIGKKLGIAIPDGIEHHPPQKKISKCFMGIYPTVLSILSHLNIFEPGVKTKKYFGKIMQPSTLQVHQLIWAVLPHILRPRSRGFNTSGDLAMPLVVGNPKFGTEDAVECYRSTV